MPKSTTVVLPVLPRGKSTTRQPSVKGSLASASTSTAKALAGKLQGVQLDDASLSTTLAAAIAVADRVQARLPPSSGLDISEIEISFGVSATGKVGFLGTGLDIECEASFTIVFTKER